MKKILHSLNGLIILLFLSNNNQLTGQTILLSENFSGFKNGTHINPSTIDVSGILDQKTSVPGWTGSKIYDADCEIKLGTSTITGWIETPPITIPENVSLTLSYDIRSWPGDNTSVQVYINGIPTGNPVSPGEDYRKESLAFTDLTGSVKIKLAAVSKRFYVDNLTLSTDIINKITGIHKKDSSIKIFPVPATDILTINNLSNVKTIHITDLAGRNVYSKSSIEQDFITIPVGNLHSGYYLIRIITINGSYAYAVIKK